MSNKITYPYQEIENYVSFFNNAMEDIMENEGWGIFSSGTSYPDERYESTDKYGDYWQVQRIDHYEDEHGKPTFPILKDDSEAWDLARSHGFILDEDGILIGFKNKNFLTPSLQEEIAAIKKKMLLKEEVTNPLDKYKEDKQYGYGEAISPNLSAAQKIALNNAKIDYSKKNNLEELSDIKIIEDKTFREQNNQYKKIIVITLETQNA